MFPFGGNAGPFGNMQSMMNGMMSQMMQDPFHQNFQRQMQVRVESRVVEFPNNPCLVSCTGADGTISAFKAASLEQPIVAQCQPSLPRFDRRRVAFLHSIRQALDFRCSTSSSSTTTQRALISRMSLTRCRGCRLSMRGCSGTTLSWRSLTKVGQ